MAQIVPANVIEKLKTELYLTQGFGFDFRIHQENAIEAYLNNNFGLFDITCGVGKTLIQACIVMLEIERCIKEGKQFKGLFVCHRLMLEDQIKENYIKFFGEFFRRNNVEIRVLNSEGDNSFEKIAQNDMQNAFGNHILYFTTCASINDFVKNHTSKYQDGKDVIAQKVFKQLSLYIHDEGHKEFSDSMVKCVLNSMKYAKAYWFTATPGEYLVKNLQTISKCSFADAVKAGYIVKPVLFPIKVKDIQNLDNNAEANVVIAAFKHLKRNKKNSDGKKEVPSLITFHDSVDGVRSVGDLINDYKSNHPRFNPNVYEIVSDKSITDENKGKVWLAGIRLNGNRYNDGKLYTKKEILKIVREDRNPKIILNAFMLTEGIDLPEINGVLIACEKSDASLYQAISRGCRAVDKKENFYLYTVSENGLDLRMENFLAELVKFTDGCFNFGGAIEDVNNGSVNDDDDNDSSGVETTIETEIYKNVSVLIKKKKTEFDNFKVERSQIEKFRSEIQTTSMVKKLSVIREYTQLWAENKELLEEFCSSTAVFGYLK